MRATFDEWFSTVRSAVGGLCRMSADHPASSRAHEHGAPVCSLIGMRPVDVTDGRARFVMEATEVHSNVRGVVHGGMLATLLDSAMGIAARSLLDDGVGFATTDLSVSFLRAVRPPARLAAEGWVLRAGRRVVFAQAHVVDEDGTLVATGSSSIVVLGS